MFPKDDDYYDFLNIFLILKYFVNIMLPIRRNLLVLYSLWHSLLPLSSKRKHDLISSGTPTSWHNKWLLLHFTSSLWWNTEHLRKEKPSQKEVSCILWFNRPVSSKILRLTNFSHHKKDMSLWNSAGTKPVRFFRFLCCSL